MKEDKKLYKRCEAAVDARLKGKRLAHVHSVADYAPELARIYGVNEFDARVAGLLHDWDKLLRDDEFPARMAELSIEPPEQVELMWPVLHSFTGAAAVRRAFPELSDEIIQAIHRHTLGAVDMSGLDMVIFIADIIEPLRKAKGRPGLKELRAKVGTMSLDELYFEAYAETMMSLVRRRRCIHPSALEIWNALVARHHAPDPSRQGDPDTVL